MFQNRLHTKKLSVLEFQANGFLLFLQACQFPFIWKEHVYSACTIDNHNVPWCAISVDQSGVLKSWGNCTQKCPG